MKINIRLELETDYRTVEELTREAFWDLHVPGCDEHLLIHKMRNASEFIPELDFVAEIDGKVVGNIAYAKAFIEMDNGDLKDVILFGPLSVLPEYHKKGIGSALICHSISAAKDMGFSAILIYGDPKYYNRFGFVSTRKWSIRTKDGKFMDALMGLELTDGALDGISGRFIEPSVYTVNEDELETFDKGFPYKEKHVTDTQWTNNPPQ